MIIANDEITCPKCDSPDVVVVAVDAGYTDIYCNECECEIEIAHSES
jgi:transcription elongation factor Elf1